MKKKTCPSLEAWLQEAKQEADASKCGMYLFHNGVVRKSARARVRLGDRSAEDVIGMRFSYDGNKAAQAVRAAKSLPGIYHVRVWLNEGTLQVGDDIMLVLVGGDTRPHVTDALQTLVEQLKSVCVTEQELYRKI